MSRPRSMTHRSTLVVVLLVGMAGCVRPVIPGATPVYGDGRLDARPERNGVREPAKNAAFGRKVVHGKESPGTLVAPDGSRCTVTEKRFHEVKEGDEVTCAWRRL